MRERREEVVVANPVEVLDDLDDVWIASKYGRRR